MGPILMLRELRESLGNALELTLTYRANNSDDDNTHTATTPLVLGNQTGYSASNEKLMIESEYIFVRQFSLGPLSLLTSQCIIDGFLNKLAGFILGAICRLGLQQEESSKSSF
jgi:hypothetical protein